MVELNFPLHGTPADLPWLLLKLIPLLLVCCIAPGLLIVSRLRLSPLEKLCGAFAASFILIYLASFTLFCLHAPPAAYWATSLLFALMGVLGRQTARLIFRHPTTRAALFSFAFLLCWYTLHLAMVRHYGGGDWEGDWREHYQRTQYFTGRLPNDFLFLGVYQLPARPPMMNLIAAFFCRQVGLGFEAFSIIFLFLNAWAFLPCCLLLAFFARRGRRFIPILAILFMLNPSIVQNATLTVTKAMTAGWVVLGVCLYLRQRLTPAALCLAAGILSHYFAVTYALALALHALYLLLRRRQKIRRFLPAFCSATALLATWFVWSLVVFGPRATFLSNTAVTGTLPHSALSNVHKVFHNLLTSLVPHPFHPVGIKPFSPPRNLGDLRDYYFMMTQTTLPMMIGLAGGVFALILVVRFLALPPPAALRPKRDFGSSFSFSPCWLELLSTPTGTTTAWPSSPCNRWR